MEVPSSAGRGGNRKALSSGTGLGIVTAGKVTNARTVNPATVPFRSYFNEPMLGRRVQAGLVVCAKLRPGFGKFGKIEIACIIKRICHPISRLQQQPSKSDKTIFGRFDED